ncbi:uncharacterized protein N7515_003718 [Penicillium bovifimosum]|uniref:Beta-lactamase-related domain-containing protein n=1 Tax=Penicillium bovifimosum TaxID=126998 RepID=A0A9W9L6G9_9EURO|nr:uncharacterized protein N7515_003718 [Penicillium bovifimosum]KAJ5138870.1 hypothetical protein N7515_003718 [Penicillium bovifimosum]
MRSFWMLLGSLALVARAQKPIGCPILGPAYPAPTGLSQDPVFLSKAEELTAQLNEAIENGTLPFISAAAQIFSGDEDDAAYGFYLTDEIVKTGSVGVREVDENTIFRIGSVSKLWTMFLYMTLNGTRYFHEPVANYVPELRVKYNATQAVNDIDHVSWSEVTIGELASHQAGIARDYAFGDLGFQSSHLETMGFPPLFNGEELACGNTIQCDRKEFFKGFLNMHPLTLTSHTPIYSNAGYQILGYALEAIADTGYEELLLRRLIEPLNLTRSYLNAPDASLAVVPYNETYSWFSYDIGEEAPAGGIFSSAKDMSTFGRAILSNALIDPATTRRWLKPLSHTSSLQNSVGAPWEIYSYLLPRRVDLYTKAGDIGLYSSSFALSPDHNAGFTVLVAGPNSHQLTATIAEMTADILLPALDEIAKNQALERFGGTYALESAYSNVNSSITITADEGPGLVVSEWINDSVDMIGSIMALQGVADRSALTIRLQPSGLQAEGRMSFSAVIYALPIPKDAGPMLGSCFSWILLESMVYGSVGLHEFEFGLDAHGGATSLSPRALRVRLPRV